MHRRRAKRVARLGVVCLCACGLGATARAERADLSAVAEKVAQELEAKKAKRVAVFDFVGPGNDLTALGQKLADDFSAALAQGGAKLHVENRMMLAHSMKEFDCGPQELEDPISMGMLARYWGEKAAVLGTISREGDEFRVSVRAVQAGNKGTALGETEHFSVAVSDAATKLTETYLERGEASVDLDSIDKTVPNSGTQGYSFPRCIYCPSVEYSDLATKLKLEGTVVLIAIVSADGRATDIHVVRRLPAGLTAKAIEGVQHWKFQPARGPDGKPAAVRQMIEVTFHLY